MKFKLQVFKGQEKRWQAKTVVSSGRAIVYDIYLQFMIEILQKTLPVWFKFGSIETGVRPPALDELLQQLFTFEWVKAFVGFRSASLSKTSTNQ